MRTYAATALACLLSACSSTPAQPDAAVLDATPGADATTLDASPDVAATDTGRDVPTDLPPPMPETRPAQIGPITARSGEENTVCVRIDVGNDWPMMLRGVRSHLTAGSHHLIVTRVNRGTPDTTPQPCGAFAHGPDALFIAQSREASLTYPAGTGVPFAPHQIVGLEMHYVNYVSQSPAEITGSVEFDLVPIDPAAPLREVHFEFTGNLSLTLPARQRTTVQSFHTLPTGAQVFALTTHTHQLGERSTLQRATSERDTMGALLHTSINWSEPPLDTFNPLLTFAPGEGLLLTCEFNNTTDNEVHFGLGFADEMCFYWAHYVLP